MGGAGTLHDGVGEPALLPEPVLAAAVEVDEGVRREELRPDAPGGGSSGPARSSCPVEGDDPMARLFSVVLTDVGCWAVGCRPHRDILLGGRGTSGHVSGLGGKLICASPRGTTWERCRSTFKPSMYLESVTTEDQWIGDLGHLALADATLGALLIDMLTVLAHARYPEAPLVVNPGLTTKQAAREVGWRQGSGQRPRPGKPVSQEVPPSRHAGLR